MKQCLAKEKLVKKSCKHKWFYSTTVSFYNEEFKEGHYRVIHCCEKCNQLDIQTIYR